MASQLISGASSRPTIVTEGWEEALTAIVVAVEGRGEGSHGNSYANEKVAVSVRCCGDSSTSVKDGRRIRGRGRRIVVMVA